MQPRHLSLVSWRRRKSRFRVVPGWESNAVVSFPSAALYEISISLAFSNIAALDPWGRDPEGYVYPTFSNQVLQYFVQANRRRRPHESVTILSIREKRDTKSTPLFGV